MAKVVVVEDEVKIAKLLSDYLVRDGFETTLVHDGLEALGVIERVQPDLVVLDVMLPGMDGLSLCRTLRNRSEVGILMLTARVDDIDRVAGLDQGADDYVCKPFHPPEVDARGRAILRRARRGTEEPGESMTHENVRIDLGRHRCEVDGESVDLTRVELRLLQTLMTRPGQVYSRDALMQQAYEDERVVSHRTVDSHIKNLRQKLRSAGAPEGFIRSVYGVGYALEDALDM